VLTYTKCLMTVVFQSPWSLEELVDGSRAILKNGLKNRKKIC